MTNNTSKQSSNLAGKGRAQRLVRCICKLGVTDGVWFWKLQNRADKIDSTPLKVASSLSLDALLAGIRGDPKEESRIKRIAARIKRCHEVVLAEPLSTPITKIKTIDKMTTDDTETNEENTQQAESDSMQRLVSSPNLKEHTAVISIDSDGGGSLMKWSEYVEDWHKEDHECMNLLPEYDFGKPTGVYQATMKGGYCAGSKCDGYPCAGDCYETEWEIGANLFILA